MKKNRGIQKYIPPVLLLLITGFIWGNSMLPATVSSAESHGLLDLLRPLFGSLTDHVLRKLAHFTEFSLFGFLVSLTVRNHKKRLLISVVAAFFAAFLDETIQIFSYGRGPAISDVWIDVSGAVLGIVIFELIRLILKKKKD